MSAVNSPLRMLAFILMGLALFLTAGGHYALLQTVAWTTMVNDFSRTGSLSMAVEKTFDGRHPCPLLVYGPPLFVFHPERSDAPPVPVPISVLV